MHWLKDNFLGYIDGWEEVMGREEFTTTQRKKMCLSQETLEGLRITGKYRHGRRRRSTCVHACVSVCVRACMRACVVCMCVVCMKLNCHNVFG